MVFLLNNNPIVYKHNAKNRFFNLFQQLNQASLNFKIVS